MKSIAKKIAEVVAVVKQPPKSGFHKFHNFDYSTRDDVFGCIRGELATRGVAVFPSAELVSREPAGKETRSHVRVCITMVDGETGDTIEQVWDGEALTKDDKGIAQATTQALRFWAIDTFMLFDDSIEQTHQQPQSTNHEVSRQAAPAEPFAAIKSRLQALGLTKPQGKAFFAYIAHQEGASSINDVPSNRLAAWGERLEGDDEKTKGMVMKRVKKVMSPDAKAA